MKKYMGKFSSVIKGIQSHIVPSKIHALSILGGNMDLVKKTVEQEVEAQGYIVNSDWYKRECGRRIGIISEYVASMGFLLKIPFFTNKYGSNYQLHEWDKKNKIAKKVISVIDVSGGSSAGGEIDILIIDDVLHKIWCFSSKFRKMYDGNIHWGDTEVDRMPVIESRNNKCFDSFNQHDSWNYGTFIFDRNHIVNNCKKYKDTIIHDWQDIKAIWEQVFDILVKNNFDSSKLNGIIDSDRIHLVPRFHQIDASTAAINYWNKNIGKFFLFDHICRSGKTITALHTCKQMGFKNVLLITNFPCINEMEWGDTIQIFYDFEYWNVVNFSGKQGQFNSSKQNFVMVSFQDLKSNDKNNQNYGWDKPKFDDIRNIKWDCIIVDEVHYGYETNKSKEIVEGLDFKYCLALSATPFVNYFRNTFDFSNTHRWTIFDEKQRSKTDSIYTSYPEMHFLLFAPPKNIYSEYLNEYVEEDGLTWNKLLRVKEDGTFFYEKDIDAIIKFVFGEKNSSYNSRNTPFGWAREHGIDKAKGILIFVPECCQCKPLQKRLLGNETVKMIFGNNVHYTYSDLNKSGELKSWLKKNANPPFIIIAVGQLTTGVTVSQVDTVILMDDGESPQQLMQRMFRCRTAMEGKKDAFVIDLNPSRTLRMVYEYTATLSEIDKKSQIDYFKEFFSLMPIVYCKDNKIIDCSKDLNKIFQEASNKYYNCFGKASLIKDLPEYIMDMLSSVSFSNGDNPKKNEKYTDGIEKGKSFKKKSNSNSSGSKDEDKDDENGEENGEDENSESDKETQIKMAKQKLIAILQSMCWASVLSGCQFDRYEDIFNYLEKNPILKREYDRLLFD